MRWRKVSLIGVGLLGGSLGMALRQRGLAQEVCGYVRRQASLDEAIAAGAVDTATIDLSEASAGADLVVLCTPLAQMAELSRFIAPQLPKGALVTDVGSVKEQLVHQLSPIFSSQHAVFVGSHPMAGSEKMGVSAARAELFQNAICVVTPTTDTPRDATSSIEQLWTSVGARTLRLDPCLHDQLVSRSSHLPHVLAALLARYVLDPSSPPEQARLCANGFKDSTRIASGSPEMWRDIVLSNREHLLESVAEYIGSLETFVEMLQRGNGAEVEEFFRKAKTLRDAWGSRAISSSPE